MRIELIVAIEQTIEQMQNTEMNKGQSSTFYTWQNTSRGKSLLLRTVSRSSHRKAHQQEKRRDTA